MLTIKLLSRSNKGWKKTNYQQLSDFRVDSKIRVVSCGVWGVSKIRIPIVSPASPILISPHYYIILSSYHHITYNKLHATVNPAITIETMLINFIKILRDGPDVSLKGSPTVSPTTVALCVSLPVPP